MSENNIRIAGVVYELDDLKDCPISILAQALWSYLAQMATKILRAGDDFK